MDRLPMTGAYAPSATCKHGVHPYDCREGCDPHEHARYDHLHERIRELEALLARALHTGRLDTVRSPAPAPPHLADEIRQALSQSNADSVYL